MNVIETRNLTKTYGRIRGITDVTLTVKEGDFFGFIGPNGVYFAVDAAFTAAGIVLAYW